MELLEILKSGRFLELSNGRCHLVNAALRFAPGILQMSEIHSFDTLVLRVEFHHDVFVLPSDHLNGTSAT